MSRAAFSISSALPKESRAVFAVKPRGRARSLVLRSVCVAALLVTALLRIYLRLYTHFKRIALSYYGAQKKILYWREHKDQLLRLAERGYKARVESLGADVAGAVSSKNGGRQSQKVELGEIDQDGFLLSKVGTISGVPKVSQEQFLARKRFGLRMIALDGYVCIEKHYKGNKSAFVNEIEALYHLGQVGCNVPVIMGVDFNNLTLTFSYILGTVLREALAERGAVVRDRDIEDNPELTRLGKRKRALQRISEGRRVLPNVINSDVIECLFAELKKVHQARFVWNDIKYGNVIIERYSGKPYMVDFDWALRYPDLSKNTFRILRDRDVEKFNACFETEKPTYKRIICRLRDR